VRGQGSSSEPSSDHRLGHGTAGQLESYVMGLLEPHEQRSLEAHVSGCLLCARALATEARRELALTAAIAATTAATGAKSGSMSASMSTSISASRSRGRRWYHGPLLAMAAALALVASLGRQRAGMDRFSVTPGPVSAQAAALASGQTPLLACLLDGEEALCPAAAGRSSDATADRSFERASSLRTAVHFSGGLCRARDGTCTLQSRQQ
jgi:hypothetical protein